MERTWRQRWFTPAWRADIALFGYTAVAGDGGFDLSGYPRCWTAAARATPGFVEMPPASGQAREWIALSMQAGRPGHEDDGGRARH